MHPEEPSLQYPPLTPIVAPWMRETTNNHSLIRDLFEQYGSPINLHNLGPFADNYRAYKKVLDAHNVEHTIFFARKANKCRSFVAEAKRLGFGVDTASYQELNECLEGDCDPGQLVVTAAVKNERLVRLALTNDVLLVLDNEDECRLVNKIAGELGKTPAVGIRISGFNYKEHKLYSRFGFDIEEAAQLISYRFGTDRKYYNLHFKGFQFHLDGYSIDQREAALLQTIELADRLQEEGIDTSFIDIGGGFLTNYLTDKNEWEMFWGELKKAKAGDRSPITFNNNGLGYKVFDGELKGTPDVYPYFNETPKEAFLDKILSFANYKAQKIPSLLRERNIALRMEPGRSLLDQTGMTLANVAHRKKDQRGNWLIGLQMNRSQLFSSSADFLVDPIFIPLASSDADKESTPVYLTGAYCLEGDIILKRKIMLPRLPEIGDAIAFPNTAGYMMHFYETRSHLLEFTTNLVTGPGSPNHFVPDELYVN